MSEMEHTKATLTGAVVADTDDAIGQGRPAALTKLQHRLDSHFAKAADRLRQALEGDGDAVRTERTVGTERRAAREHLTNRELSVASGARFLERKFLDRLTRYQLFDRNPPQYGTAAKITAEPATDQNVRIRCCADTNNLGSLPRICLLSVCLNPYRHSTAKRRQQRNTRFFFGGKALPLTSYVYHQH